MASDTPTSSTSMASPRPCSLTPLSLPCTNTRLTWPMCLLTMLTSRRSTSSHRTHLPCLSLHPIFLALLTLTGAHLRQASTPVPVCQDIPMLICPPTWAVTTNSYQFILEATCQPQAALRRKAN